jgi:ribosomal protein S18 acetylase RimI-like enzyme
VRRAGEADAGAVAHVITEAFGGDEERVRRRVEAELLDPGARYYVGELAGRVIGTLKVYPDGENAGIYAFGILPTDRERGYGRELLGEVIERMRREGHGHAYLEVDDDNEPAQRLYRAMGFVHTTTYVYYDVPL